MRILPDRNTIDKSSRTNLRLPSPKVHNQPGNKLVLIRVSFGRFLAVERENSSGHQDMVKILQILRFSSDLLTASKGHEIRLPDQDIRHRLAQITQLLGDLLLHLATVPHINKNKRLDVAMSKYLGGP
ncbi:hypothetical protein HG530_015288 [Fusarium avenaceum]|nr:hypothetical protein HG530_015288 [Fusarium avenaceum]